MTSKRPQVTMVLMVYVVLLLSLQFFLLAVAVEAFLGHEPSLAWSATAISAALAAGSALFYRQLRRG
jgi:hypothetical protein